MRHIGKYMLGIFAGAIIFGSTSLAAEVTPANAVLYTNEETVIYADADLTSMVVLSDVQAGLPVQVTGITNNGFFQIDIEGCYYVPGYGLEELIGENITAAHVTQEIPAGISEKIYSEKQEYNEYITQVVELVNEERRKVDLNPLVYDEQITYAATQRSYEMAEYQYFAHARPNGDSCFTVMDEYHVSWRMVGENIASGYTTPEQVMTGWMNSQGHKENILTSGFTKIGVGIAANSYGRLYWTQLFAA